jgi:surface polysaccharide O-acyltransferase-like enzyme
MTGKEESTTKGNRIHWMDNLRTFIIFLVVLYHAGGVYESTGGWAFFWIVDDPATNRLVDLLNAIFSFFVMPTMFFLAGYVTPMSLKNTDGWAFLKSRFRRLIIPWIIAVLTLIPLYKVIFLYSRGLPQEHWTTYFHFSAGNITGMGWLWFLPVLFLFNTLYLLFSRAGISIPSIPLNGAILGAFLLAIVSSVAVGALLGYGSWTHTPLIDFENQRLLPFFLAYLLGSLSYRQKTFDEKPKSIWLYIVVASTAWIPTLAYIFLGLALISAPGGFLISPVLDMLLLWLFFYLAQLFWVYLSIQTFWRYVDRTGRIWNELNRNSYYVYIIHVIVLGLLALLLLNTTMPSLLKYLTLAVSTFLASNLISSLFRRAAMRIRA